MTHQVDPATLSAIERWAIGRSGAHRSVLMLRAYFDDSGSDRDPRTPFSLIGGCIGSLTAWSRLERDWQAVLSEFGVAWLHMKDFAHSTGEFAGWDANEPKRQAFLGALVAVLLRDASAFIGCAVSNSAFSQLSDAHQHGLRHPYFLAFRSACWMRRSRLATTKTRLS